MTPPTFIIGVDECGRGSLIGEVVTSAVILPNQEESKDPKNMLWNSIKDSKKVRTHKQREELADFIKENAVAYAIGTADQNEVDEHNILKATMMAMHRALDKLITTHPHLSITPENTHIQVDGCYFKPAYKDFKHTCIVKGDSLVKSISAASILAKTHRDNSILNLVRDHPEFAAYQWQMNMGYGTYSHRKAIKTLGLTPYHRRTFTKKIDME